MIKKNFLIQKVLIQTILYFIHFFTQQDLIKIKKQINVLMMI